MGVMPSAVEFGMGANVKALTIGWSIKYLVTVTGRYTDEACRHGFRQGTFVTPPMVSWVLEVLHDSTCVECTRFRQWVIHDKHIR